MDGSLAKKKILIVEDDRALQSALAEFLLQEGCETINAFDGEEGLQKTEAEKPDLILLDLILPKKDGFEVLAEIMKGPNKDIPVLILTNLEDLDNVQKALDLGAKTFMIKSDLSLRDIVEKVKENLPNADSNK
ncbi:MAG TPA: response regulator [Candidatus Bathyarchaeia archaeon]|nr:response regulator [Candidatus Bathyarchaeia archaeon]